MKTFKTNLTNLKTQIHNSLPEGPDIFGYPGVSREALCAAIDTARSLSEEIKASDEALFPVISLKRAGKASYDKLKSILDTVDEGKKRKQFDEFLDSLAYLVEKTKIVYFIVAKDGLRSDEEISRIRSRILALAPIESELSKHVETLQADIESFKGQLQELASGHEAAMKQIFALDNWHKDAANFSTSIETEHENVEMWAKEIGESKEKFKALRDRVSALSEEGTIINSKLTDALTKSTSDSEYIRIAKEEHIKISQEINKLLEDANRAGMASSFLKRKKELQWQLYGWQFAFCAAIGGLLYVVKEYLLVSLKSGASVELVGELAFVSPLVWLGWFAAKQHGYISRIQEDYAFKSAAAMAYEGHKSAARASDPALEGVLLEFSLYNLAQNPLRIYRGLEVHASPWSEFFGKVVSKLCRLAKIKAEVPQAGSVEVAFDNAPVGAKPDDGK
ncbi:hypothetical protein SAMN04488503_1207 [Humidesulfovibrio mexicanus]|uniref:Uncharacterized protein n=1 Tax=Humidesulfovibrio mexicanus TaxID=147047 RepID=A0A238Z479_9BACT|nr:hypothetical protein [Humidesulfovibrio mexicanus]SNR77749.1 hypothetical protein SAMN04488503_1207 [Humidesulfovibrio mexicanus]